MTRTLVRYGLAFAAAAAMPLAALAATPQSPPSFAAAAALQHRPIKPYLDKHGHALRNARNSILTSNWSGYAVANFETALYYGSASATWQMPTNVSWGSTSGNPYGYEYNSIWVGIGGFCESAGCSGNDQTLIQLGTEQTVSQSGAVQNYVWYELYPAVAEPISYPVNQGDIVTASLNCTANCRPGQTQTWQLSMTDQTLGWTWSQSFNYASSMLSADWIIEAPYYNGILPLNNFSQANFDPLVADGNNPNVSQTANSIAMNDPYGQTSNPSSPNNGDWFGGCWGYGSMTPCTAASFSTSGTTNVIASLTASPNSISSGSSSTLNWDSANANSCSGSGFSASGTSGAATVFPTATTTYSVTCSGASGSATSSTTVNVGSSSGGGSGTCHGKKCK